MTNEVNTKEEVKFQMAEKLAKLEQRVAFLEAKLHSLTEANFATPGGYPNPMGSGHQMSPNPWGLHPPVQGGATQEEGMNPWGGRPHSDLKVPHHTQAMDCADHFPRGRAEDIDRGNFSNPMPRPMAMPSIVSLTKRAMGELNHTCLDSISLDIIKNIDIHKLWGSFNGLSDTKLKSMNEDTARQILDSININVCKFSQNGRHGFTLTNKSKGDSRVTVTWKIKNAPLFNTAVGNIDYGLVMQTYRDFSMSSHHTTMMDLTKFMVTILALKAVAK